MEKNTHIILKLVDPAALELDELSLFSFAVPCEQKFELF